MRSQLLFAWNHWNILQLRLFIQPKSHKLARACFWHCFWTLQRQNAASSYACRCNLQEPRKNMLHQRNIGSSVCKLVQQNAFDPTISNTSCNGSLYDPICHFVPCASLYSQRILGWESSQSEAGASAQVRVKGCAWCSVAGDLAWSLTSAVLDDFVFWKWHYYRIFLSAGRVKGFPDTPHTFQYYFN